MLNPIIEKDLKTKMRGWRTPILLSLYLLFLALVLMMFFVSNNQSYTRYGYSTFNPRIAVNAYSIIAVFQFALLMLIVPALTSTAISGERERQTLDLMLCSDISTWSVIMGKLVVSIAHIMFLVVASLPILGMVFLFGGITLGEILLMFLFYVITALMVASLGIFLSTLFKKNVTAIISGYICLGLLGIGPIIAFFVWTVFYQRSGSGQISYGTIAAFLFPSPAFGFTSFMSGGQYSIFGGLFYEIQNLASAETGILRYLQPWMINAAFDIVFSAILICLSAWKLNPVKRIGKNKKERRQDGKVQKSEGIGAAEQDSKE